MASSSDSSPILDLYSDLPTFAAHNKVRCEDLFDQFIGEKHDSTENLEVKKPKITYGRRALDIIDTNVMQIPDIFKTTNDKRVDPEDVTEDIFESPTKVAKADSSVKPNAKKKDVKKKNTKKKAMTTKESFTHIKKEKEQRPKPLKDELLVAYRQAMRQHNFPDWDYIDQQPLNIISKESLAARPKKKTEPKKNVKKTKKEVFVSTPLAQDDVFHQPSGTTATSDFANETLMFSIPEDNVYMCSTPIESQQGTSKLKSMFPVSRATLFADTFPSTTTTKAQSSSAIDELINVSKPFVADYEQKVKLGKDSFVKKVLPFSTYSVNNVISFEEYLNKLVINDGATSNFSKLGEGSFADVFLVGRLSRPESSKVIKVAHLSEEVDTNIYSLIYMELLIMKSLEASIKSTESTFNFISMTGLQLVSGQCPKALAKACETFRDRNKKADIKDKDLRQTPANQMSLCIEMPYGGVDLEHYKFKNAKQALSIYLQISLALAVAEDKFQFEHRDLHLGNVLVKTAQPENITYQLQGATYKFDSAGVIASIIDFTLSRMKIRSDEDNIDGNEQILYQHFDDTFFPSTEGLDYQFEIYRMMRDHTKGVWKTFAPKTNVFWLHYLVDKLRTVKYTKVASNLKIIEQLNQIHQQVLTFDSALQFVSSDNFTGLIKLLS